jgi:uncharacterized FlaG/YvyC family protein
MEEQEKRTRGRGLSSYPVSVQIKTIVNAAEKFNEKQLTKLIEELNGITDRVKEKRKFELEKEIERLKSELQSL